MEGRMFDQSTFVDPVCLWWAQHVRTHRVPTSHPSPAGLSVDGLYRVSGNLAVIQKLRFAVNHGRSLPADHEHAYNISLTFVGHEVCSQHTHRCADTWDAAEIHLWHPLFSITLSPSPPPPPHPSDEKVDLNDSKWEDIHVTTGALKMFFRELPEPLFTYGSFNDFVNAISE